MTTFDAERFRAIVKARRLHLGEPLVAVPSTPSTNDLALQSARAGGPHGATFVADSQTDGRGRQGRRWFAAPGESLLASILLRPNLPLERAPELPLVVGVAIARVANVFAPQAEIGIKWPNDVLSKRRKLAGVLVESQVRDGKLAAVVVGVGLNLKGRVFPPELSDRATSLSLLGSEPDREAVLADFLDALSNCLATLERGSLADFHGELDRLDALRGQRVTVDGVGGIARGIDACGRLLLLDDNGREHALLSGHVVFAEAGY